MFSRHRDDDYGLNSQHSGKWDEENNWALSFMNIKHSTLSSQCYVVQPILLLQCLCKFLHIAAVIIPLILLSYSFLLLLHIFLVLLSYSPIPLNLFPTFSLFPYFIFSSSFLNLSYFHFFPTFSSFLLSIFLFLLSQAFLLSIFLFLLSSSHFSFSFVLTLFTSIYTNFKVLGIFFQLSLFRHLTFPFSFVFNNLFSFILKVLLKKFSWEINEKGLQIGREKEVLSSSNSSLGTLSHLSHLHTHTHKRSKNKTRLESSC